MVLTITSAELADLVHQGEVDLVDVRDQDEWDSGHIANSRLIPLETLRANPEDFLARGSTIVFVCAKGVRSLAAAKLADRFGYENLYTIEGGIKQWAREGMSLVVDDLAA